MALSRSLWAVCAAATLAFAQSSSDASSADASSTSATSQTTARDSAASTDSTSGFAEITFTGSIETITTEIPTSLFTGTYASYASQITLSSSSLLVPDGSQNGSSSPTDSQITRTSTSKSVTEIVGGGDSTSTGTGTASSTSTAPRATNTQPCNNYPEFCNRKYSNITEVCSHNSAFVVPKNAASNQKLPIEDQLNDGIRMLQGETHYVNNTIYNCHTSCDLLNVGTWQSELELVAAWLANHPFDVLTMLIVNSDYTDVQNYVAPIQNSGIAQYLYEPDYIPQYREQWPTLGEMILSGKRMVMFMDYQANQTAVPYILDEFSQMWETPFSPQNQSFPCTQQRPPNLSEDDAKNKYMYLANHNLNTAIDVGALLGTSSQSPLLIPNVAEINQTNGEFDTFGQLGEMAQTCTEDWGRPPNFLLVDYYNYGDPKPGSVFEVAAKYNGVTYNRECCGPKDSAAPMMRASMIALASAIGFAVLLS